jgi:hypothetical protein
MSQGIPLPLYAGPFAHSHYRLAEARPNSRGFRFPSDLSASPDARSGHGLTQFECLNGTGGKISRGSRRY